MGVKCSICSAKPEALYYGGDGDLYCRDHLPDDRDELRAEVERLRAALVEKQARGNWLDSYSLHPGEAFGDNFYSDPGLQAETEAKWDKWRAEARAELIAEGLLPPE